MKIKRIACSPADLDEILAAVSGVRVCIVGDVCVDAYWYADMRMSELSREIPHFPLPVVAERYSPGGAGNVAACIAALKPAELATISLIGRDWRGDLLQCSLKDLGIHGEYLIKSDERITPAYCRPICSGGTDTVYESTRMDFENRCMPGKADEQRIVEALESVAREVDVIAVSDQFRNGIITEAVRKKLSQLGQRGVRIVVDSRKRTEQFHNVIVKPNELEAAAALGVEMPEAVTAEAYCTLARSLSEESGMPVIVTLGAAGAIWVSDEEAIYAPSIPAKLPCDTMGAGDAFLSAFACAYGAGIDCGRAIAFANTASAVTVKKIGATGTASPEEIVAEYRAWA